MNAHIPSKSLLDTAFTMPLFGTYGLADILSDWEIPKGIVIAATCGNHLESCTDPNPVEKVRNACFVDKSTKRSDAFCGQKDIYEEEIIEIDIADKGETPGGHSIDTYTSQSWGVKYFPARSTGGIFLGANQEWGPEDIHYYSEWVVRGMQECEENVLQGIEALLLDE